MPERERIVNERKRLVMYASAYFFASFSYAIISTFMIPVVKDLGGNDFEALLTYTMYSLGMITSLFWGNLSDIKGREKVIKAGYFGVIPVACIGIVMTLLRGPLAIYSFYFLILLYSIAYAMVYPLFVAEASLEQRPAYAFGASTLGGSLGWGIGGVVAGSLATYVKDGLLIAQIISAVFFALFVYVVEKVYQGSAVKVIRKGKYKFGPAVIAMLNSVFILQFGLNWVYGLFSIKTYVSILGESKFYYSLFAILLPGVVGAVAAPAYMRFCNRFGGLITYGLAIGLYSVLLPFLARSSGYIALALWALPIWPAYDIGSKKSSEELVHHTARGKVMGALTAVMEVAIMISAIGGIFSDEMGRNVAILIGSMVVASAFIPYFLIWKLRSSSRWQIRSGGGLEPF